MMDLREFQQLALAENGVQNDADNVQVVVEGKQYTIEINDVLDHEEEEPFEASCALEDVKHGKTFMINIAKKIIAL